MRPCLEKERVWGLVIMNLSSDVLRFWSFCDLQWETRKTALEVNHSSVSSTYFIPKKHKLHNGMNLGVFCTIVQSVQ